MVPMAGATQFVTGPDGMGCVGVGADDLPYWERNEANGVAAMKQLGHRSERDYLDTSYLRLHPHQNQAAYKPWVPHVNEVHVNQIKHLR